jgi:hypothetical protein
MCTLLVAAIAALTWTSTAAAYTIVYYFGSPSTPVIIAHGTAGSQTAGTAFRLFNEATARTSGCGANPCGEMDLVALFYNTTWIGGTSNTYYYIVYQNGPDSHAGCQVTNDGIPQTYPTYAWCDTTA